MELIACALWIWGRALAGLLGVIGQILMLPGRLVAWIADRLLDALGED